MLTEQQLTNPDPVPSRTARKDIDAWNVAMDEMIARGMERVHKSKAQLIARGLYDEQGNKITTEIPYDMRPGSDSDVGG